MSTETAQLPQTETPTVTRITEHDIALAQVGLDMDEVCTHPALFSLDRIGLDSEIDAIYDAANYGIPRAKWLLEQAGRLLCEFAYEKGKATETPFEPIAEVIEQCEKSFDNPPLNRYDAFTMLDNSILTIELAIEDVRTQQRLKDKLPL